MRLLTASLMGVFIATATLASESANESAAGSSVGDARSAAARLELAFARRYDCDLLATMQMTLRSAGGETRERVLVSASKRRGGRLHSLGRFREPPHLRGLALLSIEALDGPDQMFVYLPSVGRSRRVGGARSDDPFLGSDLRWSDFERHRVADYQVLGERGATDTAEPAWWIETRPLAAGDEERRDFLVADSDAAILGVVHRRHDRALRRVDMPRDAIAAVGALRVPLRVEARDLRRGTRTRLDVRELAVDPPLDDRLFSVRSLETGRPLPNPARVSGRIRSAAD